MKKFYCQLKYFLTIIVILAIACKSLAQCTITIPPLGSGYTNNTTVINKNDTTIPYYATAYVWICAGDTVYDHYGEGGGGGPGTVGIFFLEQNAAFIYDGGGAEYTIYAKAGSYYHGSGNDWVYADSTATIAPGSAGGCCGAVYQLCPQLVFDYSNIAPGTGCLANTPPPIARFGANPLNVCAGSTVTFTDSSMDGPTSWNWTFQGGTPGSSSSQNPVITYNTAGTFNVKLVATNASGSDSLTKTGYITVTALPNAGTISAAPDTLCAGSASTVTVTGSTGPIQWQSGTAGIFANISSATDTFYYASALTQNTGFRIIAANGICTDTSAALQIRVNPAPTAPVIPTNDTIFCAGDSALIISQGTYSSYQWNTGDTSSFIYAHDAGAYRLTVTNANGCTATSNRDEVAVYPTPTISVAEFGDTLECFGFISYQWYNNGQPIAGATDSVYVMCNYGSYQVQVTDSRGCTFLSQPLNVVIEKTLCTVAVTSLTAGIQLNIYPNPFSNTLFIKEEISKALIQQIAIYDVLGNTVLYREYTSYPGNLQMLDVSSLPAGAYILRVKTVEGDVMERIIKE